MFTSAGFAKNAVGIDKLQMTSSTKISQHNNRNFVADGKEFRNPSYFFRHANGMM
jgi:hypothetical protein